MLHKRHAGVNKMLWHKTQAVASLWGLLATLLILCNLISLKESQLWMELFIFENVQFSKSQF